MNQIMGNLIALIVLLSVIITAVGEIFTTGLLPPDYRHDAGRMAKEQRHRCKR